MPMFLMWMYVESQNIMDNDDKLKDKQKKTDVTEIIREAPDKD